jgi:hypothetical protein
MNLTFIDIVVLVLLISIVTPFSHELMDDFVWNLDIIKTKIIKFFTRKD